MVAGLRGATYTKWGASPTAHPNKVRSAKSAWGEGVVRGPESRINRNVSNASRAARKLNVAVERSSNEEEGANREDRPGSRRANRRGPEALRGLRGGRDRSAQGRRGSADHGLRKVLRQGAQGQGGQESSDRPEDEDRGAEGSRLQRGQRPQAGGLGAWREVVLGQSDKAGT